MHELSVAENILTIVAAELRKAEAKRITEVHLEIIKGKELWIKYIITE